MGKKYTAIIRKSQLEYVALRLDLNLAARGETLAEVETNLRAAIELYKEDLIEHPETVVAATTSEELIEFLRDTQPEWYREPAEDFILRLHEIHEVPAYA